MTITIGGKYGSGGKAIAEKLAEITGFTLCGDEVFKNAILSSGMEISESIFEAFDESLGSSSINAMKHQSTVDKRSFWGVADAIKGEVEPVDERLGTIYKKLCEEYAEKGSCIILGHFADFFLRERHDCLRVFVIDAPESRIKRISDITGLTPEKAEKHIAAVDKRRADYYAHYTDEKWGEFGSFDLLCDCTSFGIDGCAELIKTAAGLKK